MLPSLQLSLKLSLEPTFLLTDTPSAPSDLHSSIPTLHPSIVPTLYFSPGKVLTLVPHLTQHSPPLTLLFSTYRTTPLTYNVILLHNDTVLVSLHQLP